MPNINFSIPSSLAVQGSVTISGLVLASSGNYRLLIGNDYAIMSADLSGITGQGGSAGQTGYINNQRVSGNFTGSAACQRYFWTGIAMGTGSLPAPSTLSGFNFAFKNLTTGVNLFVSGSVDYYQNTIIPPLGSLSFTSDNFSWIIL